MAGFPTATPGSAEGVEDLEEQSKVPPASHTPGSAEGGAFDAPSTPDQNQDSAPDSQ